MSMENRDVSGFINSEENLLVLQYLLENIAAHCELSTNFIDKFKNNFDVIVKMSHLSARLLFESLLLDPLIWQHSSADTHSRLVSAIDALIKQFAAIFDMAKVIDLLLNSIEVYALKDPGAYSRQIDELWKLCMKYVSKEISYKVLKIILSYLNVHYIKKFKNHLYLLLNVLKMLLDIYLNHKSAITKLLHAETQARESSMLLSTLLGIMLHFTRSREKSCERESSGDNSSSRRSAVDVQQSELGDESAVDRILGICVYVVADFDWKALQANEELKSSADSKTHFATLLMGMEDTKSLKERLIKSSRNTKKAVELNMLTAIFSQCRQYFHTFGETSYKALKAIILSSPQLFASEFSLQTAPPVRLSPKSTSLLLFALDLCPQLLAKEQVEELISLAAAQIDTVQKKMTEANVKSVLSISQVLESEELAKVQAKLLLHFISPASPHLCSFLTASSHFKLNVVERCLILLQENPIQDSIKIALCCIDLAYALEDIYETAFYTSKSHEPFAKALARLLLFASKADLLYVSVPVWGIVESRRAEEGECQEREGGVLRIILKLTFMCMKAKVSMAITLLKFTIFGERESKNAVKKYLGIKAIDAMIEGKGKKNEYTLLKLMQEDQKTNERVKATNDFIIRKVIGERFSVMSKQKVKNSALGSESNFFSNGQPLIAYLFTSLIQLIYFELFNTTTHEDFARKEGELEKTLQACRREGAISENCSSLLGVMGKFISENDPTMQHFVGAFKKHVHTPLAKKIFSAMYFEEPNLDNVYSVMNYTKGESIEKPKDKISWDAIIDDFMKNWGIFSTAFIASMRSDSDTYYIKERLLGLFLAPQNLFKVYPMLLLITTHPFHKLDSYINRKANSAPKIQSTEEIDKDFIHSMWKESLAIKLPKKKLTRDKLRDSFKFVKQKLYHKATQELHSELGCYYEKSEADNKQFEYVNARYDKLVKRVVGGKLGSNLGKFVKLSTARDGLGRSMMLKKLKQFSFLGGYEYLRLFVLKKMLIRSIAKRKIESRWYESDFKIELVRKLFSCVKGKDCLKPVNNKNIADANEYIPVTTNTYTCELITTHGAVFGKLFVCSKHLLFMSAKRTASAEYKSGAMPINQLRGIKLFKKIKLDEIAEIVVKRYNLTRHALEIYLTSSKSFFFNLFKKSRLAIFLSRLHTRVQVVDSPERHFFEANYADAWTQGDISNFQYLTLLNKYGGRSFNDLNQYPVFPWILLENSGGASNRSDKPVHRKLDCSIAQIKNEKEEAVSESVSAVKTHYLSSAAVFSYMRLLEPYTSLVPKYDSVVEEGCFDVKGNGYFKGIESASEVIPEFYYLPDLFANNSLRFFKNWLPIQLPSWVNSKHQLVEGNTKALESLQTSLALHKWIDLIFGVAQQAQQKFASDAFHKLTKREATDIQNNGVNPIKLFLEKHPQRKEGKLLKKVQYFIFNPYVDTKEQLFTLVKECTVGEESAIVHIGVVNNAIIAITSLQDVYMSAKIVPSAENEASYRFKKAKFTLFPFKPFYDSIKKVSKCDSQRCFGVLADSGYLVTCRHYDNSWRIINSFNGRIIHVIHFHKAIVNCVHVSGKRIMTGSGDGVVAMWELDKRHSDYPIWHALNHTSKVVSLDGEENVGVAASGGKEGSVALRRWHDGKLIGVLKPELRFRRGVFAIAQTRVSCRGYVVVTANYRAYNAVDSKRNGYIFVYSINGEMVAKLRIDDFSTGIILNETGDEFVITGAFGALRKYELGDLREHDLYERVDEKHSKFRETFKELERQSFYVSAANVVADKGWQHLVVGTNLGCVYTLSISSRMIMNKLLNKIALL